MTLIEAITILVAGIGAGTMNTIVGSGTLITFPTLLALGYPPVIANVSNCIGLVPGGLSGVFGYRRELEGQRTRLLRLGVASLLGGTTGALLLLKLPASAFRAIIPVLIAVACVLVVAQPWISRHVRPRHDAPAHGSVLVWVLVYACGIYGGYFGAAQGVLMIAIMGIGMTDSIQRINAAKNLLVVVVNGVAALIFIAVADVDWAVVALIAAGSVVGGIIGASVGRRLPPPVFRGFVAVVGLAAITKLLFFD